MNRLFFPAVALALAGCSQAPDKPAAPAPVSAPAQQSAERTVELDAAARQQARLQIAEAVLRPMAQVLRANGRLVNNENATWRVGAVTEGRIVNAFAKVGDQVKQGQLLAEMHSHDIHEARAQYQIAQAEVTRQRSNLAFSQRQRDRMKRLYELKAASLEQLEHSENEVRNSTVAVSNAEIEVERTHRHLTEYLGIPALAQKDEDDHIPIRAPAAGVILQRNITPGAVVTPSSDLYILSDLSTIWTIASVQEEHLPQLRIGMPARVFVQAYAATPFSGRISKIGESLDPATRTVSVRIELANAGGRLKPEMYASVELDLAADGEAVVIPEGAAQDVNGQTVVFVEASANKFAVRPVELGRTLNNTVEVVRGVKAGERVVAQGSFVLKSQLLKSALAEE